MIKAITFDLDGVYFPNGKANFIMTLGELGISEEEAKRVFLKSDQMNQFYKNGKMTDEEFWTWAAKEWQLNKSPKELIDLLVNGYDVDERVTEIIKKVRANGYKTLICSNNFKARIDGLQKKIEFLNDFDAWVFSFEVGVSKPSPVIFQELVERADVPAETIVFADDNPDNLAGAKEVGIETFLYEGFDKFMQKLVELGVKI
ncbi:MAG: HAD-IA family hydrolase [Patescibacteria group bacterium]|nr:HAD-IA family hydrolase [Patescibacteria group bacterium]